MGYKADEECLVGAEWGLVLVGRVGRLKREGVGGLEVGGGRGSRGSRGGKRCVGGR